MAGAIEPRAQATAGVARERVSVPLTLPRRGQSIILDRIRLIVRTIEEHPGLTGAELADRIGYGHRHTSLLLLRLEERGHVRHDGRRWYPATQTIS